jgi:P-type Ca2+ transporter type 2C
VGIKTRGTKLLAGFLLSKRKSHLADNFDLNNISHIPGLSEKEAADRLSGEGFNEIPSTKRRSFLAIAYSVVREPMLLLLVASGVIYMVLGDLQ